MVGQTIAHYQVTSKLGAGGMGEVYLAEDTRLHRRVALKILPADLASNKDRMRCFEQEAIAAAALNHPNIAHIYEIGEHDGANYIAMEFVDGDTFTTRMHRDKNSLGTLLKYLSQVAEGMAKAHAAGIVHRDLKPDNIMITRDGYAKILDFGLAKLIQPHGSSITSEDAATAISSAEYPVTQIGKNKRAVAVALVVLFVLIAGGVWVAVNRLTVSSDAIQSLAVMPFVNAGGNADIEYLSDGMTEALISSPNYAPAYVGVAGSYSINASLGAVLTSARRYDEAIAQLQKTLELDPNFVLTRWRLATAFSCASKHRESIAEAKRAMEIAPNIAWSKWELTLAYTRAGDRDVALKMIEEIKQLPPNNTSFMIGTIYDDLGDKDQAFEWLNKAYENKDWMLTKIHVEPWVDNIGSDPRLADLVRRMGLNP